MQTLDDTGLATGPQGLCAVVRSADGEVPTGMAIRNGHAHARRMRVRPGESA